jgi:hypothetical protein
MTARAFLRELTSDYSWANVAAVVFLVVTRVVQVLRPRRSDG